MMELGSVLYPFTIESFNNGCLADETYLIHTGA